MRQFFAKAGNNVIKSKMLRAANELFCALLASAVLGMFIPWGLVFSETIPAGGDNPAHPVLMKDLGEAFFSQLSIVHYSYKFWGGFEMFQFYFPLPYLVGSSLSWFIHPNIAFKLITLFGILALPAAFYCMARFVGMGQVLAIVSSLLGISFLFTNAHVMWGGNVYSDLAGMIGNAWAFVFFVLAFGRILRARMENSFSLAAVLFSVFAVLSHFYALVMLFMLFGAFVLEDLFSLLSRRVSLREVFPVYSIGVLILLLMAWWLVPLLYYAPFSAAFGGEWNIDFLATFTTVEKIVFGSSLLIGFGILFLAKSSERTLLHVILFLSISLVLFFANDHLNSVAFSNNRLWPGIYFSFYAVLLFVLNFIWQQFPNVLRPALFCPLLLLIPANESFRKAEQWYEWNFSGLEAKSGWSDFREILRILKQEPPSRISFESNDENNNLLATVRAFEIIPYLTEHEIIEGGIVNSATFPGIAYTLQCLTSNTCAGWPPGSIVPAKDIARAIEFMQALGVGYHIATADENEALFNKNKDVELLFRGNFYSLYKLKTPPGLVEVFSEALPVLEAKRPHIPLLAFPRFDALRNTGVIFNTPLAKYNGETSPIIDPLTFLNFSIAQWRSGYRVSDRGWENRLSESSNYLNTYLFSWRGELRLADALTSLPDFFVADRSFDPNVLVPLGQEGYSEVGVPLLRMGAGNGAILIHGSGYQAYVGEEQLPFEKETNVYFAPTKFGESEVPFALLKFIPLPGFEFRSIDVERRDPLIQTGFPGPASMTLPTRITNECHPILEKAFHELRLRTDCPGKPHLIKYSYYPKWRAEVPIHLGTNGFMVLTPTKALTILKHQRGMVDWISMMVSLATFVAVIYHRARFHH